MVLKGAGRGQRLARCGPCSLAALPHSWKELGPAESPSRKAPIQHPLWFSKHPLTCSLFQEEGKAELMFSFLRGETQAPERGSNSLEATCRSQH